ncbi:trypsin-like peptidase domain-containing protein [Streptomyces hyaluromycini]|uniref:Trypsin-like peptidase domain-containing protein n=1 Tax=Streptomyces hyaluromycini TaxID=1377993 RepID=A0ABV1WVG5_9ACTN
MDRRRLALVRGGEETGFRRVGSGYLVAPRLVLTARHVVEDGPGSAWPRIDVRVGHPQDADDTRRCAARVCWTHPDGRDVALLLLDDPVDVPGAAVRWGRPVGEDPLPYEALGFPWASAGNGRRRVEHLRGELPVLGGGTGDQDLYVLDQGPAPDGTKAWSGASGSAVFCHGHLVGVVIHDDKAFENRRLHACPARSFAADPDFAALLVRHGGDRPRLHPVGTHLERYLRAARLAAIEHPYPGVIPGTMPPLAHIYVRQQVVRQKSPADNRSRETGLRAEGPLAVSPPQPADEVLTGDGTCLVVGGPGGGKSSLLRTRLTHGVTQWLDDSDATTHAPVLVPAAALQGAPLSRALVDAVNAHLRQYGLTRPLPDTFFEDRPGPGRGWLVLVDGLDEITSPAGREDVLRTVAHAGDQYTFIVAGRPVPEAESGLLGPHVPRYQLEPFDPQDLERVATGWFRALDVPQPEQTARQFLTALGTAGLTELARVPLTMSMLCQLRAEHPGEPLPRGRGEIYRNFVELLHERQYAAGAVAQARAAMSQYGSDAEAGAERTVQGLQSMLAHAAHHLLFTDHPDRPVLDIVDDHPSAKRPTGVPERRWHDFLASALCGTGLLTRRSDDLVFTHQTLVEYFAARHVVDDEERLDAVFRKTFIRRARFIPLLKYQAIGAGPRLWFSAYWVPPGSDPYAGFLLDLTPDDHPLKEKFLGRMASRRAGLDGYLFLARQMEIGTALPEHIVGRTVDLLRQAARDQSLAGIVRVIAAETLTQINQADGAALLQEFARDHALDSYSRLKAANELIQFSPAAAATHLRELAQDTALDSYYRRVAMCISAELSPVTGVEPPPALALDASPDGRHRVEAARVLAKIDPAAATERLRSLVVDHSMPSHSLFAAAEALMELAPAEGAMLLRAFALDPTRDGFQRVQAAAGLSDIDPISTGELLAGLAREPSLDAGNRLWAAQRLLWHAPQPAQPVLRELSADTTLGRKHRRQATRLLAGKRR